MSDYLEKETPDPETARLVEQAEESKDQQKGVETLDPKKSTKKASDELGVDPSKQRVIRYDELKEEEKTTPVFTAKTGERQQEV
jgi:hypothetical protein